MSPRAPTSADQAGMVGALQTENGHSVAFVKGVTHREMVAQRHLSIMMPLMISMVESRRSRSVHWRMERDVSYRSTWVIQRISSPFRRSSPCVC